MLLVGCGDDSSDGTSNVEGIQNEVSYSCEVSRPIYGLTYTNKVGANGKIYCGEHMYSGNTKSIDLMFTENVYELEVKNIEKEYIFVSSYGKVTVTEDFATGVQTLVGEHSVYGLFSCRNIYNSKYNLPYMANYANEFMYLHIDDYELISTTCPDWVNTEDEMVRSYTELENITVTDTSDLVSKISIYSTLK